MKSRARGIVAATALLAAAALSLGAGEQPSQDEGPRCHGRQPTIVGTDGPDALHGTSSRDVIWGGLGDDTIIGSLGNDLICGGPGADLIHGGRGNDVVDGGAGSGDIVVGDLGDDRVLGGPGDGDEVAGSLGIDVINGGSGSGDLVHGDYGNDRMDGGTGGGDVASFATDVASSKGAGVRADLAKHRARGDGHDRLFRFENLEGSPFRDVLIGDGRANRIDGGPGDDTIMGGKGADELIGGQGSDRCRGSRRRVSCGKERTINASAYVTIERSAGAGGLGGGLAIIAAGGDDDISVSFDEASGTFGVTAAKGIAVGRGCARPGTALNEAACAVHGPARWLTADLGPGDDHFRVVGSLTGVANVRIAGGTGNDVLRGGPEDDLIEAGPGSDRLYGRAGADGLIGSLPGPTSLYGGANGDLLAAGGGCAGGRLVGGPGRDDASFAETQAHPGTLIISFRLGYAWIDAIPGCHRVRLAKSNEDMEGSFDNDILVGDASRNAMLGQPGQDKFYGGGGDDVIDARDGMRDFVIKCGRNSPAGRAISDSFDPAPQDCAAVKHGRPVPGLHRSRRR